MRWLFPLALFVACAGGAPDLGPFCLESGSPVTLRSPRPWDERAIYACVREPSVPASGGELLHQGEPIPWEARALLEDGTEYDLLLHDERPRTGASCRGGVIAQDSPVVAVQLSSTTPFCGHLQLSRLGSDK